MARTATAQAEARPQGVVSPFVPRPALRLIWSAESLDAPVALEPGAAPHMVAYHRGYMCGTAGEMGKSLAFYHQAIKLRPDFADAYSNVGYLLAHTGKLRWAIDAYRKATLLDPNSAWAHDGLGNWLREAGQLAEAVAALQKATALRPDWEQAQYNFGNVLGDAGQFRSAINGQK
jgi:tetratricopeptide (TPR) repeat protein